MGLSPTHSMVETPSRAFYREAMDVLVPRRASRSSSAARSPSCTRPASTAPPRTSTSSSGPRDVHRLLERLRRGRLRGRSGLLPLARQDPVADRLHRRDLQLRQRHRRGGRRSWFEHATEREVLGVPVQGRAGGGDHLVQGVRDGARALRRRRRRPPHPGPRRPARLAPPDRPVRRRTGGCCSPTWCCSASSTPASAPGCPPGSWTS